MSDKDRPAYEIGSAIDPGRKRIGGANQDSLIVLLPAKNHPLPPVVVVADGMGGYSGGAAASQIVVQKFSNLYTAAKQDNFSFVPFATEAIDQALVEMQKKADADVQYANMGSTVVALSLEGKTVNLVNVGDSRGYLIHNGEMKQINYDHSFVGEAMRVGLLTPAEAMKHPKKNQLTQSISARRSAIKPYFAAIDVDENDLLFICSDGLWGVVPEAMIQAVVTELPPQQAAEKLVKLANSRGGPDNISVIICRRSGAKPINPFIDADETGEIKKVWSIFNKRK